MSKQRVQGTCLIVIVVYSLNRVWLWDPMGCNWPGSSVHGISPGKNTAVGCHFLLQGIFPTQVCVSPTAGRFFTTELPILKKRNPERGVKWQLEEKIRVQAVKCHLTSLPVQFSMHFNFCFSYRVYIPPAPPRAAGLHPNNACKSHL